MSEMITIPPPPDITNVREMYRWLNMVWIKLRNTKTTLQYIENNVTLMESQDTQFIDIINKEINDIKKQVILTNTIRNLNNDDAKKLAILEAKC
jgi:GTP-dependent phosphoenolpyruvate carboxykinase